MFFNHIATFQKLSGDTWLVATKLDGTDREYFHPCRTFRTLLLSFGGISGNNNVIALMPIIFVH